MTRIEKVTTEEAKDIVRQLHFDRVDRKTMDFCLFMSTGIWAGFIDDGLACLWGLIPPTLLSQQAYLWLYTTELIKEHQFLLIRHSQRVIEDMLKEYPSIVGHATVGNDKAVRWLRWLGAKFGQPQGIGIPFRISVNG